MRMTKKTFERRVAQLVKQLEHHPHRDEIVAMATSQIMDSDESAALTTDSVPLC